MSPLSLDTLHAIRSSLNSAERHTELGLAKEKLGDNAHADKHFASARAELEKASRLAAEALDPGLLERLVTDTEPRFSGERDVRAEERV